MNTEVLIDYAGPCMAAERALRDLHEHMLEGKYDAALTAALEVATQARLTYNAIVHMKEQRDVIRQQTTPL